MTVEVKKEDLEGFSILLACDDENYTELYYNRHQELFTVDRTYSGKRCDLQSQYEGGK